MRIRANEFRIGNLISVLIPGTGIWNFEPIKVETIKNILESPDHPLILNNIKPIQITEDWLLKFGFKKHVEDKDLSFPKEYKIAWIFGRYFMFHEYEGKYRYTHVDLEIKHVHQLQNLCFALTGEELKYV